MFDRRAGARVGSPLYYGLFAITVVLVLFGTIMIFSASQIVAYAQMSDSYFYLKKHAVALVAGFVALVVFARIRYQILNTYAVPLVLLSLGSLVLVLAVGTTAGGTTGWFDLGVFSLQPSEFAKICVLVYLASAFSRDDRDIRNIQHLLFPVGPLVALFLLLLALQPDFGTAFVIGATSLIVAFVAGARAGHLGLLTGPVGLAATIVVAERPYIQKRIFGFLDAWGDRYGDGYHIVQSLIALGSGGPTGVGLGMSRQKFFYLPAGHTDFILSIVGEELGLGGTLFVVLMFGLLAYCGVRICFAARDPFGKILAAGLVSLILFQALTNMGVAVGLMPITGVTLPLLSFGGSSLLFTMMGLGILMNIAAQGRDSRRERVDEGANMRRRDSGARVPGFSSS